MSKCRSDIFAISLLMRWFRHDNAQIVIPNKIGSLTRFDEIVIDPTISANIQSYDTILGSKRRPF